MNIAKLMGNPPAQYAFEAAGNVPARELGDLYRVACARGDKDVALVVEVCARALATMQFQHVAVRDALWTVEHTSTRAYGKGGTSDLKAIAKTLRRAWHEGSYLRIEGGTRVEFTIGTLTLRCRNNSSAVEMLALKYERGCRR